jgi:hypothetical protein
MYTVAAYMYVANGAWERSWYCRCQAYVHSASSSLQNGNAFSLHHMWCCALHWRLVLQTAVGSLFSIRRRRVIKGAGGSYPSSPAAVLTLSLSLSLCRGGHLPGERSNRTEMAIDGAEEEAAVPRGVPAGRYQQDQGRHPLPQLLLHLGRLPSPRL